MKNTTFIITIFFLCSSLFYKGYATVSERDLPILSIRTARSQGLGGGGYTCISDAYGVFENPSMLANILYGGISSSYSYTPYGDQKALLSYVYKTDKFAVGVGIKGFFSEIITTSSDYITTKTKNTDLYYETSLTLAGAYRLDQNSMIGMNIEGIYTSANDFGMALDMSYSTSVVLPALRVSVGFEDLGFYQEEFAAFDTKIVTGIGMHLEDGSFSVGVVFKYGLPSLTPSFGLGAELMIIRFNENWPPMSIDDEPEDILDNPPPKNIPNGVKLRLGFTESDFSLGTGINFFMFTIDYAATFNNYSINNIAHTVSINAFF